MDNISHSLASVVIADSILKAPGFTGKSPAFKKAVFLTSFAANNLPDLDFVPAMIHRGDKVANVLMHRGFTHSFAFVPIGGLFAGLGAFLFFRRGASKDWIWRLGLVGALGILMHVFMDFLNDYGVHPFSPWRNDWFYGDTISVIEPLFWFSLIPFVYELIEKSRVRFALLALEAAMMALMIFAPYTRGWVAVCGMGWAAVAFGLQKRFKGWVPAVSMAAALLIVFGTASRIAHSRLKAMFPEERALQLIVAPAAANPFCWRLIHVSERSGDGGPYYSMRLGAMSLWPGVVHPESCFYGVSRGHDAPLTLVSDSAPKGVYWAGEFVRPVRELYDLSERSCEFARFRRFARAPFWVDLGPEKMIGDLRYDRGRGPSFSEIVLNATNGCSGSSEAIWDPPVSP